MKRPAPPALCGRFIDIVGAAEVTAVVVGDLLSFESSATGHFYPAFIDELLQEGSMVDDFVVATQFGIFIPERIEAMRTGGHDLFDAIPIQHLDILVRHHLEHELVAGTAGGSPVHIFLTQDRVADAYLIEDGNECLGDLLRPLVETAGAAHPKQYIGVSPFAIISAMVGTCITDRLFGLMNAAIYNEIIF